LPPAGAALVLAAAALAGAEAGALAAALPLAAALVAAEAGALLPAALAAALEGAALAAPAALDEAALDGAVEAAGVLVAAPPQAASNAIAPEATTPFTKLRRESRDWRKLGLSLTIATPCYEPRMIVHRPHAGGAPESANGSPEPPYVERRDCARVSSRFALSPVPQAQARHAAL
jgi:hypothetical protein